MREMLALPGRIMNLMFWTPILFAVLLVLGVLVAMILGSFWWVGVLALIAGAGGWIARRIRFFGGSRAGVILACATGAYVGALALAGLFHLVSLGLAAISTVFWGTLLYGMTLLYVEGTRGARTPQGRRGRALDLASVLPRSARALSLLIHALAALRRVWLRRRPGRRAFSPLTRRP